MGIRNKITNKGFVSTNVPNEQSGFFGFEQQVIRTAGEHDVVASFVLVSSSVANITASLPVLEDDLVGVVVKFVAVNNDFLISASNPIISDGGTTTDWTREPDVSNFQIFELVAIGGSNGPALLDTGEKFAWVAGEIDTDV